MDALQMSRMNIGPNKNLRELMVNEDTINDIIERLQLKWYGHVKRMPDIGYLK